jgi:hypothetical protein
METSGAKRPDKPKRVPLAGCIFCGGRPLTGEHVLPQWLRTFAGLDYPDGRIELKRDDEVTHEKSAPAFSQKLRVACKSCNTGWMHDLEEEVKTDLAKMVQGGQTLLTSQTARYIATWLVKTFCVFEYADLVTGENIPREHYDQLFERKTSPPDWCQAWIASTSVRPADREIHLVEKCCERINVRANAVTGEEQYWWFGTIRIGAVMLQVVGSRGDHPVHLDRKYLADQVVQLWPKERLVVPHVHQPAVRDLPVHLWHHREHQAAKQAGGRRNRG